MFGINNSQPFVNEQITEDSIENKVGSQTNSNYMKYNSCEMLYNNYVHLNKKQVPSKQESSQQSSKQTQKDRMKSAKYAKYIQNKNTPQGSNNTINSSLFSDSLPINSESNKGK